MLVIEGQVFFLWINTNHDGIFQSDNQIRVLTWQNCSGWRFKNYNLIFLSGNILLVIFNLARHNKMMYVLTMILPAADKALFDLEECDDFPIV